VKILCSLGFLRVGRQHQVDERTGRDGEGRVAEIVDVRLEEGRHLGHVPVDERRDESFLRREVLVERTDAHAGRLGARLVLARS